MLKGKPINSIKSSNKSTNTKLQGGNINSLFKSCFLASIKDSIKKNQPIIFSDPKDGSFRKVSVEELKRIVKQLEK